MPLKKKLAVLLSVLGGLLVAGYYTVYLLREDLKSWNVYKARFAKVIGLKKKDQVRLAGYVVGRVAKVELFEDANLATLELEPHIGLHEGASAEIQSVNSFGDVAVFLTDGPGSRPLLSKERPMSGRYREATFGVQAGATETVANFLKTMEVGTDAVVRGEGGPVGRLLSNKDMARAYRDWNDSFGRTIKGARETLGRASRGEGLGALVDRTAAAPIREATEAIRSGTDGVRRTLATASRGDAVGILSMLAADERQREAARGRLQAAAKMSRGYRRGDHTAPLAGFLSQSDEPYRLLAESARSASATTTAAVRGEGMLGTLSGPDTGRRFKSGLGAVSSGLDDAIKGRSGAAAILAPGEDRRRAMEELATRVENAISDFRDAGRGLRQGTANTTLHGALFTVF